MEKNFIEFFSGIGLVHEALAQLGWNVLLANDNDPKKAEAYKANYPDVNLDSRSIHELNVRGLPRVDLVTASFPCIDLSQAGYRGGINGKHSGLVWEFLNKVRDLHEDHNAPDFILIENVPNLLSIHEGTAVDFLLNTIASLGYAVDVIQVDAKHFVPQSRNRVFIIGALHGYDSSRHGFVEHHIRRYKVREVHVRNPSLPWMSFNIPHLPERQIELTDIIEPLEDNDPRWWDAGKVEYFWGLLEKDHVTTLQHLLLSGKKAAFTAVRRLRRRRKREQIFNVRFDGLASCLRTPKGGSSTQYVIEIAHGRLRGRRLLGIEAARLQGVCLPGKAPDFRLPEKDTDIHFAFGDAVCVPAVKWVVENTIETIIRAEESADNALERNMPLLNLL